MQQNDMYLSISGTITLESLSYPTRRFITEICLIMLHESIALPNIEFQDN